MKNKIFILILFCSMILVGPASAQESAALKLSITPPLFKVNMNPGETWSSVVKLVNNNSYPVTVYAEVLDFKSGPAGGVEFIKDSAGGSDKNSLSGWVDINREPLTIAPQQSAELPFFIKLPADADPGGHYAAILAGSKPPADKPEGSAIKISSMLASLILVRVSGEVVERGEIREFSVDKSVSGDLSAKFKVTFANTGNTHLVPQGEIKLTNFWGETRAIFPISQKSSFGNVLPDSVKEWEFEWHGSSTIMDTGRMRADLVIGYGEEATQTDARTIYFWTLALKPMATALGIIILILLGIILLIRRYINKSLRQVRAQAETLMQKEKSLAGAVNLRADVPAESDGSAADQLSWSLFKRVTIFLVIIISAALIAYGFYFFGGLREAPAETAAPAANNSEAKTVKEPANTEVEQATSTENPVVAVTDTAPTDAVATTSATSTVAAEAVATTTEAQKIIRVKVENGGGVTGAGARAAELIKSSGAQVASVGNADNFDHETTEIRYGSGGKTDAETINKLFGGTAALIEDAKITDGLVVVLGKDFK
jgi:hypothetical protein